MLVSFFTEEVIDGKIVYHFHPDCYIEIVARGEIPYWMTAISSVEYTDGAILDIYYEDGNLMGVWEQE